MIHFLSDFEAASQGILERVFSIKNLMPLFELFWPIFAQNLADRIRKSIRTAKFCAKSWLKRTKKRPKIFIETPSEKVDQKAASKYGEKGAKSEAKEYWERFII